MLHAKETRVATPRFPVIDVHTHFTFAKGGRKGAASEDAVAFTTTAKDALAVMDRKGVKAVVNLTGGFGSGLEQAIAGFDRAHPGGLEGLAAHLPASVKTELRAPELRKLVAVSQASFEALRVGMWISGTPFHSLTTTVASLKSAPARRPLKT